MFDKLLSVQNISVDYTSNSFLFPWEKNLTFRAVDNVSFDVLEGETLGMVGETGSGKSTIAKAIINILKISLSMKTMILFLLGLFSSKSSVFLNFFKKLK